MTACAACRATDTPATMTVRGLHWCGYHGPHVERIAEDAGGACTLRATLDGPTCTHGRERCRACIRILHLLGLGPADEDLVGGLRRLDAYLRAHPPPPRPSADRKVRAYRHDGNEWIEVHRAPVAPASPEPPPTRKVEQWSMRASARA